LPLCARAHERVDRRTVRHRWWLSIQVPQLTWMTLHFGDQLERFRGLNAEDSALQGEVRDSHFQNVPLKSWIEPRKPNGGVLAERNNPLAGFETQSDPLRLGEVAGHLGLGRAQPI